MTSKPTTPTPTSDAQLSQPGSKHHKDNMLESIGKAITNAMWESSGEADQSEQGAERRAATPHKMPPGDPSKR